MEAGALRVDGKKKGQWRLEVEDEQGNFLPRECLGI